MILLNRSKRCSCYLEIIDEFEKKGVLIKREKITGSKRIAFMPEIFFY